jgi:hypothetical protein
MNLNEKVLKNYTKLHLVLYKQNYRTQSMKNNYKVVKLTEHLKIWWGGSSSNTSTCLASVRP